MPSPANPAKPATLCGAWIWTPADSGAADKPLKNLYGLFRRLFSCPSAGWLEIAVSADSDYTLSLDGKRLIRGPARAHSGAWSYDRLRIAIEPGSHCLGVLAHHDGEDNACMHSLRPAWIGDIRVHGAELPEQDLSSGPDWTCVSGDAWRCVFPDRMSHFGFPEEMDLTVFPEGWDTVGFQAVGWTRAAIVAPTPHAGPWGYLEERDIALLERIERTPCSPPRATGTWTANETAPMPSREAAARSRSRSGLPPLSLPWLAPPAREGTGHYLTIDFGRTVSGYPEIRLTGGEPGQILDISYDEYIDGTTGAVNPERTYAKLTDRFRLPGEACTIRVTHPRGFRYLTLDIGSGRNPVRILDVTATEEWYPFQSYPVFTSPATDLQRILEQCDLTVRLNTADAFMDCPTRERVQWMQDLYIHARVALDLFGDAALPTRALSEAARGQLPDGRINGFFPTARSNCAFASSSLMWLLLLDAVATQTGNAELSGTLLTPATRVFAFLESRCDTEGLITDWPAGQFWSWEPIEQSGCLLLTNAFYALALERYERHPQLAPAAPDAGPRLERLRRAAATRFRGQGEILFADAILPAGARSPVVSQFANALAVLSGICPAGEALAVLQRITDPAHLGPVPVGEHSLKPERDRIPGAPVVPVGTLFAGYWLCRALFECGCGDLALAQIRELWGPYRDSPTLPEVRRQGGNTGGCHGWAAGAALLLIHYVLGLRQEGPRRARLDPCPCEIRSAAGCIPNGPQVSWERNRDGTLRVDSTTPDGWTLAIPDKHA